MMKMRKRGMRAGTVATGAALALTLAGCGSGGSGSSDDKLTYAGFGGITQEVQSETQLKPFAKQFHVEVTETEPAEFAKLKVMVESNNVSWDVIDGLPYMTGPNCGTLFEPLDFDVIDTSNIPEDMISECSVPMYLSAQMLFFDETKFSGEAPTSWEDFFDVDKFPGKRGISKDVTAGALELALLADGVKPEELYPLDHERALAKLDTIKDHFVYWSTGAEQQQQMESGQVSMMMGWPGRAYGAAENGAQFAPMWDATLFVFDVFAVPKGTQHKDTAMKYINYAIGAEPQAAFADKVPYAAVRSDVKPSSDPMISTYAPTLEKREKHSFVTQDMDWWGENIDEMVKVWTSWTAG
jgi:putative spermidine/putrescine transport system substrate-binding protein